MRFDRLAFLVFVSSLVFSPLSFASECYEKSSSFDKEGDAYFDTLSLNKTERAKNIPDAIKNYLKFIDNIEAVWKGYTNSYFCTGPDRAPKKRNTDATVTYQPKLQSNKTFQQIFERFVKKDGVTRRETLEIANMESKGIPNEKYFVVLEVSDEKLVMQSKYRVSVINTLSVNNRFRLNNTQTLNNAQSLNNALTRKNSLFREELLTFKLSKERDRLTIQNTLYQSGRLLTDEVLYLTIDRRR